MAKRKAVETVEQKQVKKPTKTPNKASISICIPSSVISNKNAHNLEQKTMIAYQIAKACLIYNVSEIIVLNVPQKQDMAETTKVEPVTVGNKVLFNEDLNGDDSSTTKTKSTTKNAGRDKSHSGEDAILLASLFQFFITPPYLVKTVFSPSLNPQFKHIMPKFKHAYKLPKITTLPFMQNNEVYRDFKEGIVIPRETPKVKQRSGMKAKSPHKVTVSKYVNVGEAQAIKLEIKREVPIYSRITVDLKNRTIVSPQAAYGVTGHKSSFGYLVRLINETGEFNKVFTGAPLEQGYTRTVFVPCDDYFDKVGKVISEVERYQGDDDDDDAEEKEKGDKNLLVVLGNYWDFQRSFELDEAKDSMFAGITGVEKLFDYKLDIPRGVRIEDGVLIALTRLLE
ncbi:uncharacterized protein LODBEIA_P50310 [Lodderomyces beijingensis]|uniref:DUF171-domain-containing protein n=1 Tax=Lodderomyces beijingensis TaxID=1775926 RepID=A0ABP0ZTW0_9ASCO